jgi:UDP-N-acetylmuramate dehydrogenase
MIPPALRERAPQAKLFEQVDLAPFTTLQAGGPAKWLAFADDIDTFAALAAAAHELNLRHMIIGSGSNILVSDKGFDGLAIVNRCKRIYFGKTQYAQCGAWFQDVFLKAAQSGLTGLEFAVGIPGTLGGALVSNAGAYRANIADCLSEIEIIENGTRKSVPPSHLKFSYRDSILRQYSPPKIALLSVKMSLRSGDSKHIYDQARDYQRQRIGKQPPHPSAGSFFKNVIDADIVNRIDGLPDRLRANHVCPAGYLIEAVGLKGSRKGMAKISEKHANFICNLGGATAADIRGLAEEAKASVFRAFGVTLEEEVLYVGEWGND